VQIKRSGREKNRLKKKQQQQQQQNEKVITAVVAYNMHILYLPLQTLYGAINAAARVADQRAVETEVTPSMGNRLGRG